jgi:hypothetical protein
MNIGLIFDDHSIKMHMVIQWKTLIAGIKALLATLAILAALHAAPIATHLPQLPGW